MEMEEIFSRCARLRFSDFGGSIQISASKPIWWLA